MENKERRVAIKEVYVNGESIIISPVKKVAGYEDEKYFGKRTTSIEIFSCRYADRRCYIVDEDTEVLMIIHHYDHVFKNGGCSHRTFRSGTYIYKDNELYGLGMGDKKPRIPKDVKKALDEYLKTKEAI